MYSLLVVSMAQQESSSQNPSNGKRVLGYLQFALIIGIVVVALVLARAPARIERDSFAVDENKVVHSPIVSVVEQLQPEQITLQINKTGNVTLDERITVRTEAQGRVAWVSEKFRNGGTIAANEVFVKIDSTEYQLRVDEAEALLQIAKLREESAAQDPTKDTSGISARVKLLETRLELAKHNLAKTEISLPYEIRVIGSDIEVGELVGPYEYAGADASVLGRGYRLEALQVSAPLETQLLEDLEPAIGRAATIAVGNKEYKAKIERVSTVVAPETRLIRVYFRFDESTAKESLPLPGMFAEISIDGLSYKDVFVLPIGAMQSERKVWVVNNGVIDVRSPNTVAITDENWVVEPFEVAEGLVVGSYPGVSRGEAVTVNKLQ